MEYAEKLGYVMKLAGEVRATMHVLLEEMCANERTLLLNGYDHPGPDSRLTRFALTALHNLLRLFIYNYLNNKK